MKKEQLIAIAIGESMPNGYIIKGYCDVDGEHSVQCTRDKDYGGRIDDCVYASRTVKSKCKHWHKVKSIELVDI